jgi:uncharacterized protein (TIGR00369 family)
MMTGSPASLSIDAEAADYPGWREWKTSDPTRFNGAVMGRMLVRPEGENGAVLRMFPAHEHSNNAGKVHGGVILSLIDISFVAAVAVHRQGDMPAVVTLDASNQFIAPAVPGRPLDAVAEVLRETGRLVFIRGLVVQDGATVASFSGSLRKFEAR